MSMKFNVTNTNFNPSSSEPTDLVKKCFAELQQVVEDNVPATARRTLALRNMEIACMYAVRAIHDGDE